MGLDFATIDADGNGYIGGEEDYRKFVDEVEKIFKASDTISLFKGDNTLISNHDNGVNEVQNFYKNNPDLPTLPQSWYFKGIKETDGTYRTTRTIPKADEGYMEKSGFSLDAYASFLWYSLDKSNKTTPPMNVKAPLAMIQPNLAMVMDSDTHYSPDRDLKNPVSLEQAVNNPAYAWITVSEGDKKIVSTGQWKQFDEQDVDDDGFLAQDNSSLPFNGDNELLKQVMDFTGAKSADDLFTEDKQREYKEKFGLWITNNDKDGNWQPLKGLTVGKFAEGSFKVAGNLLPTTSWSFRRFAGYP